MLQVLDLKIQYKQDLRVLADGISFIFQNGDKVAVIGEEGNGKSTLLKWIFDPSMIADYCAYEGRRICDTSITYLPQSMSAEMTEKTVYEFFCATDGFFDLSPRDLNELSVEMRLPLDMFYSEQKVSSLSGGEKVKIQIAAMRMSKPSILLLDEPSNDLDVDTLEWLERFIRDFHGIVLFISHDETLIKNTANAIIHIEFLRHKQISRMSVQRMSYRVYVQQRNLALDKQQQIAVSDRRQEKIRMEKYHRIQQSVEHDLRTVSRQDPHGGYLLKKKMHTVKAMEKRFEKQREQMTPMPETESAILFHFDDSCRIPEGKKILDLRLEHLSASDGHLLAKDVALNIFGPRRICIIGANGIGKTTLLKKIVGMLEERNDIRMAYMPQNYAEVLDYSKTPVMFLVPDGNRDMVTQARTFLGSMRYTTEEMEHSTGELSGGQQAKLLFLKMNLDHANVLVLDEPTRNFSPLSAPVINATLKEFGGCIISVSHDRRYIRKVCDTVLELKEDGLHRHEISEFHL